MVNGTSGQRDKWSTGQVVHEGTSGPMVKGQVVHEGTSGQQDKWSTGQVVPW